MKNNRHRATIILIIFSMGFLISYPFREDNIWMGILSSACAASMVGGLADWFAVTAIFRRPLGIYWPRRVFRTEIIPKNRDSIVKALVDIVENELLSKENIKKKVLSINFIELFLKYLEEKNSKEDITAFLKTIIKDFDKIVNKENLAEVVKLGLVLGTEKVDISVFLSKLIVFFREKGYDDELIDFTLDIATGFIRNNRMHIVFTNFIEGVIEEYESGAASRAMTIKMLMNFVLKKSPSDLAKIIEDGLVDAVNEVKEKENITRLKIKNKADNLSQALLTSGELKLKIDEWKNDIFSNLPYINEKLLDLLTRLKEEYLINDDKLESFINDSIDNVTIKLSEDTSFREGLETYIKDGVIDFINRKHDIVGSIVQERINQFSTPELVKLIEDVAGNDLQMIRINGSIVGGIVGIITFLLTYSIR